MLIESCERDVETTGDLIFTVLLSRVRTVSVGVLGWGTMLRTVYHSRVTYDKLINYIMEKQCFTKGLGEMG